MRKPIIVFVVLVILSIKNFAQSKVDDCCLSKNGIVGVWQRDDSLVASGLGQNFQFFKNGTFVFNIGNEGDDVRNIIKLKGKFRLIKDSLYFTIASRTVIDGPIEIAEPGLSLNIFSIGGRKVREVPESPVRELSDPCYITLITKTHIKINNEDYYKVKL